MQITKSVDAKLIAAVLAIGSLLAFIFLWSPAPVWDPSPEKQVITLTEEGTEREIGYIPDVQVWGDGYFVWVRHFPDGSRQVMNGRKTPSELAALVQTSIGLDAFKVYRMNFGGCDGTCLSVNLAGASWRAPWRPNERQLDDFITYLSQGAGTSGTEFVPSVARLYVVPLEKSGRRVVTKAQFHWPDAKSGHSLAALANDPADPNIYGDELQIAWQAVNSPASVVESNGQLYWIWLVIPKISWMD